MAVVWTQNSFFENPPDWAASDRAKKLGLDPLKLSLSWMGETGHITPGLEEAFEATKNSSRFGSLLRLPIKAVKLTARIQRLLMFKDFKPLPFARECIEATGKTVQLGGTIAGLFKLAHQFDWIGLSGPQDALLSTAISWGVGASIGFGVKSVCQSLSRLSENRLGDPQLSPERYRHEVRKFTVDLLKLVASICMVVIQVFSLIALISFPAPTRLILILSTVSLIARISSEFYRKIHAPEAVKPLAHLEGGYV